MKVTGDRIYTNDMKNAAVLVLMELYDHRIRQGIGHYAAEHNWYLTICDGCTYGGGNALPQGWSGDGMLVQINKNADLIRYVRRQHVPCVDMWICRPDIPMPRITGDQRLIGQTAADHLIERGFRNAVFFSTEYQYMHKLRAEGFSDRFLEKTGKRPRNLAWALHSKSGKDNWHAQNAWLRRIIRPLPKPLGIFCYSDYDAAKIETFCLEAGYSVPDDIAILGVDNDPLVCENLCVPLSSVRHDLVRVGYDSATLLDRLMHGAKASADPILVPPNGVELRASTDSFVTADPLIRSVLKFFRENISRNIGIHDASEAVCVQRHKLNTHFVRVLGETVYATLIRLRLFEVKRLLSQTDLSIKEIALNTGFCHAQHLNNTFRRSEHCTPTAYRMREKS